MSRDNVRSKKLVIQGYLFIIACFVLSCTFGCATQAGNRLAQQTVEDLVLSAQPVTERPNIILINTDDLGYGDLSCYGSKSIQTPNIDKMAAEGKKFTDFYACNALCSPSRFGLLTGRYPQRAGINHVFYEKKWARRFGRFLSTFGGADLVGAKNEVDGIPEDEITVAEVLKAAGYKTAIIGKWHLGNFLKDQSFNPLNHGFDYFYGVPFSNANNPLPLYRGEELVEENIQGQEQGRLTGLYTQESIQFMNESKEKPFFLYLAHTFPHQPFYASEEFHGKSKGGRYGDTVEELDWSIGKIIDYLKENNIDDNTLIIFTSDNGPWFTGNPGTLRGRKGQIFDGGFRVPMIAWWPGRISSGSVCEEPAMNTDILPTLLKLNGMEIPGDRIVDGKDISPLLFSEKETMPQQVFYFFHHQELQGIRLGKWKLFRCINTYNYPTPINKFTAKAGKGPFLYDMEIDPSENYDLASNYPEIVAKLSTMMDQFRDRMQEDPKGMLASDN